MVNGKWEHKPIYAINTLILRSTKTQFLMDQYFQLSTPKHPLMWKMFTKNKFHFNLSLLIREIHSIQIESSWEREREREREREMFVMTCWHGIKET